MAERTIAKGGRRKTAGGVTSPRTAGRAGVVQGPGRPRATGVAQGSSLRAKRSGGPAEAGRRRAGLERSRQPHVAQGSSLAKAKGRRQGVPFVVLTGLSGAGKSQAIRALEDLGYFCVDNLPTTLIPTLAEWSLRAGGEMTKVAIVVDVREGGFLSQFPRVFRKLRAMRSLAPASIRILWHISSAIFKRGRSLSVSGLLILPSGNTPPPQNHIVQQGAVQEAVGLILRPPHLSGDQGYVGGHPP